MANVKIIFGGSEKHKCFERTLIAYTNSEKGLYIAIEDTESCEEWNNIQFTVLDKETAVRLSKELRRQIALMD
jgi:hypothetical protein